MTAEEFGAKVGWEGGFYEAVTSYGLSHEDLDPETVDQSTIELVKKYVIKANELQQLGYELEEVIDVQEA